MAAKTPPPTTQERARSIKPMTAAARPSPKINHEAYAFHLKFGRHPVATVES